MPKNAAAHARRVAYVMRESTVRRRHHNGRAPSSAPAAEAAAVMRGVENGFAVVRAANHGLLTASDAKGRLIGQKVARPDQMDSILADLPLGPGPTLYTRTGNVFPWATLGLTLLLCVLAMRGEPKGLLPKHRYFSRARAYRNVMDDPALAYTARQSSCGFSSSMPR